jgi:hypothetical protein
MRDVSGLEAHACSVGNKSRPTGTRQRRFSNPRMRYRYFLPLLLSLIALLAFGGLAADVSGAEIAPAAGSPSRWKSTKVFP